MRRSIGFLLIVMLAALLGGCIIKIPDRNVVSMDSGDKMTFSVKVFPPPKSYIWTLDELPLSNGTDSYVYTAESGEHILKVQVNQIFGVDIETWVIQVF